MKWELIAFMLIWIACIIFDVFLTVLTIAVYPSLYTLPLILVYILMFVVVLIMMKETLKEFRNE